MAGCGKQVLILEMQVATQQADENPRLQMTRTNRFKEY